MRVGADHARRPALHPADRVEATDDAAVLVCRDAAPSIERHAVERLRVIADRRDHEAAFDLEEFAGAEGAAVLDLRAFEPQPFDTVAAQHLDRVCIEGRSEEHTSELQSLMRISYAVF